MGICWYCHWGWPKQVADIYDKYAGLVSDPCHVLDYGPGHIVWADENFESDSIQWCINNAAKWQRDWAGDDFAQKDFALAVDSLRELLTIPTEVRCCEPADYDDIHPELYPPPSSLEMVR